MRVWDKGGLLLGAAKSLLRIEKWKVVVVEVVVAIVFIQVFLNVVYLQTPGFWTGFSLLSWNLLVIGADTSFIGMYYGLKAYTGALKLLGKKRWWLVIIGASGFITSFQIFMNVIFFSFPSVVVGVFNSAAWNLLVLSASTSFLAMYFGIRAYIAAVRAMRTAKFFDSGFVKSIFGGSVSKGLGDLIDEVKITFDGKRVRLTLGKGERPEERSE